MAIHRQGHQRRGEDARTARVLVQDADMDDCDVFILDQSDDRSCQSSQIQPQQQPRFLETLPLSVPGCWPLRPF